MRIRRKNIRPAIEMIGDCCFLFTYTIVPEPAIWLWPFKNWSLDLFHHLMDRLSSAKPLTDTNPRSYC